MKKHKGTILLILLTYSLLMGIQTSSAAIQVARVSVEVDFLRTNHAWDGSGYEEYELHFTCITSNGISVIGGTGMGGTWVKNGVNINWYGGSTDRWGDRLDEDLSYELGSCKTSEGITIGVWEKDFTYEVLIPIFTFNSIDVEGYHFVYKINIVGDDNAISTAYFTIHVIDVYNW